uniref:Acyl-coenzyme A oxidase N-terminal domain-containing protein n=1 Tax=Photinus pyralis TaxID=7054 RepID=A0A1Y1M6R1_PHOPY
MDNKQVTLSVDLLKERQKCTFNTLELTYLLDGGPERTKERRERESYFLDDPELKSSIPTEYLSHKEKYEEAIRVSCLIFRKVLHLQEEGKVGIENFQEILGGQLGSSLIKDGNPLALHYVMYIPTLMGQGTYQQQAEWIQKAWNCTMIGTYAQVIDFK